MDESNQMAQKRSHDEMVKTPRTNSTNDITHERTSSTTVVEGENSSSSPRNTTTQTPASTITSEPHAQDATQDPEGSDHTAGGRNASDDRKIPLDELDWEDLEERFRKEMAAKDREESEIIEDFNRLMNLFTMWSQAGQAHETDRAVKRLKTRMGYVQGSEEHLRQKEVHYQNVVKAFESALALLTGAS